MEKKSRKIIFAIIGIMLIITTLIVCIYIKGRHDAPEHSIMLVVNGKEQILDIDSFKTVPLNATMINGKGEEKNVSGDSVLLADVIGTDSFSEAVVIAADEYKATVSHDEIENAKLLIKDNEARLIVLGDKNSKRDVKNVVRIEVK